MTIERMEQQLAALREKKAKFNADIDRRIDNLSREHDQALAAQTQRIFAKHRIDPDELNRLKFASREQLRKVLDFISEEIQPPPKPGTAEGEKPEQEDKNNAEEVIT